MICRICALDKADDKFYWGKDNRRGKTTIRLSQKICKQCLIKAAVDRGTAKEKRRRNHLNYYKLKHGCSRCGYNKQPFALDFHHIGEKSDGVSTMLTGTLKKLFIEIRKCIIVCANCHREIHMEEGFNRRDPQNQT